MTVHARPLADVTRRAIAVLTRELGSADTLRFVNQFTTGLGDYTADRERWFAEATLEQIVGAIRGTASGRPGESASPKKTKGRRQKDR